jgi:tungstate transport system substrate-binding protein
VFGSSVPKAELPLVSVDLDTQRVLATRDLAVYWSPRIVEQRGRRPSGCGVTPMRFMPHRRDVMLALLLFTSGPWVSARAEDHPFITVASTTEPQESGLFSSLVPMFTRKTGIDIYLVAVGTGEALKIGQRGECDVVFVHDKTRELQFVENGFASVHRKVMYDRFVLVGPEDDPAKIDGTHDVRVALRKIAEAHALFFSRGDESGTDAAEKRFWDEIGERPNPEADPWYVETRSGMEQTLAVAVSRNGYTLADSATWANFNDRHRLKIVVDGDARLRNQYAVMLVNPQLHSHVKGDLGMAFIEWLTSREGQEAIARLKVKGEQQFFPDYVKP